MAESLRFCEEQLRMVELPGGGLREQGGKATQKARREARTLEVVPTSPRWLVGSVARQGTTKKSAARLADEKKKGKGHGEHKGKDKGKGQGAKNNKNDNLETKGKGERGKGKGKNKKQQARCG